MVCWDLFFHHLNLDVILRAEIQIFQRHYSHCVQAMELERCEICQNITSHMMSSAKRWKCFRFSNHVWNNVWIIFFCVLEGTLEQTSEIVFYIHTCTHTLTLILLLLHTWIERERELNMHVHPYMLSGSPVARLSRCKRQCLIMAGSYRYVEKGVLG